jgi:hypothetical protein
MNSTSSISIRTARREDFSALWRVASLDDALVPAEPLLVAERDGEIVAALSMRSGEAIADPFQRTLDTLDLLRLRARQFAGSERPRRRLRLRAPVPA